MNETMVTVTGNVAGDVIARRVGNNGEHLLVTFRVASSERRWDKATESWIDGDRFTASVNCWRRLAEGARILVKGDPVVLTGRLSVREYETEAGRRYMTEIAATAVGPDLSRCSVEVRRRGLSLADGSEAPTGDSVPGVPHGVGALSEGEAAPGPGGTEESVAVTADGATARSGGGDEVLAGATDEASAAPEGSPEGATVTGIGAGDRRRGSASRASA